MFLYKYIYINYNSNDLATKSSISALSATTPIKIHNLFYLMTRIAAGNMTANTPDYHHITL